MKYTVIATDKAGVEKTINVEADSREACEKGLTARGFTGLRFVDSAIPDSFKVTEAPAPAPAPAPAKAPLHAASVSSHPGWFANFMSFRSFITTTYIKVIWWVGSIFISLLVLAAGISAMSGRNSTLEIVAIVIGLPILWVVSILFYRMCCEFLIVIFRIYEELRDSRRSNQ